MAILKTTVVNGNLFVTGSDNFVSASEFRGTASYATATDYALSADEADLAYDIDSSADIHVNSLQTTGNATIGGDLFVSGNLTYIGATDLRVKDKFIELNVAPEGTPTPSADGAGIKISGSTGNTGEDAAITYVAATDTIYINKPLSASLNVTASEAVTASYAGTATSASHADAAEKVLHDLNIGNGFVTTGSYNGEANFSLAVDQNFIKNVKSDNAVQADTASVADKVANKLTVSGNYISITSDYDGSTASTISLDLSNLEDSASANKTAASAAQADVDALETYVGTIPTSATTVVAYAKEVAESASAAEDISGKIAPVVATASAALATASLASQSAAANSTSIANLIASTSNYVESVVEGASTESFVTFTVTGDKYVTASIDDSALKTKIDEITGSIADVSESAAAANTAASAAQATADEALNSASVITTLVNNISASQVAASSSTGLYSASNVDTALDEIATMASQSAHAAASGSEVNVIKQATAETGYAATYYVTQNGTQVGEKINIPKDYLVKSGEVKTVTTADEPYTGAVVGDKYLDFVVNAVDATGTESHIYIPVKDLVDVYQGATTDEVAVTVDNSNYISASIVSMSGAKLINGTVTKAKLADAVTASLALADSAVQTIGTGSANGTISVDGTDVAVTGLGSAAFVGTESFDASGAADTVGTNVLASASNMSASLSAAIVNENSRSMAAESELSASIASLTAGMTVVETASGEAHLNVAYDGTNTYTISTVDVVDATQFGTISGSINTRLTDLETASASLHTEVSNAQATASSALSTASAASGALATEISRSIAEETAIRSEVSASMSAMSASIEDTYVNVGGDTMTGTLRMTTSNGKIQMVHPSNTDKYFDIKYDATDDSIVFEFVQLG